MDFNIRNIAAYFYSSFLLASGRLHQMKAAAARGNFIVSVYFHDPKRDLFENCVKWFLKHGFTFISVEELTELIRQKKAFPPSSVVFTADDGWKNNRTNIAAVAAKYKIPVTIFASTQPIETGEAYWWSYAAAAQKKGLIQESVTALKKWQDKDRKELIGRIREQINLPREAMTKEDLQQIAAEKYVHFGSHTLTHPILITCTDNQSQEEIAFSKTTLENWLNTPVRHFAYPNGLYQKREITYLQQAGYQSAFTTVPEYITPANSQNIFELPRFDVLENISFKENICRMTGLWFYRKNGG